MKIIIAPDSFKGSLSATEVAEVISKEIKDNFPKTKTVVLPIGDGGEGTMKTLVRSTNGQTKKEIVLDPLGKEVTASYGILGNKKTCVVEMARASGLNLVPKEKLSPLKATSFGTGQLIKKGLDEGFKSFIIAIGGSASNDGGAGMLQALGAKLLDNKKREVELGGGELKRIHEIDLSDFDNRVKSCEFTIASDVNSPFIGNDGASHVFGYQKGATEKEVISLESNMLHWANLIEQFTGVKVHHLEGAGAAGGLGGAFKAFFPSKMQQGIDVVLEHIKFKDKLINANLVITGEGQLDYQTFTGKVPFGVAKVAQEYNVPSIMFAGSIIGDINQLNNFNVISVNSIIDKPMSLEEAMYNSKNLLRKSVKQIMRTYLYNYC